MYLKHKHEKQAGIESGAEVQEAKQDEIQGGTFLQIMATYFMAWLFIKQSSQHILGTSKQILYETISVFYNFNPS